ncbi:hypothetical protein A33M_0843 [Rhodovulum sp. PH10]|nr:hypothetical protein A33M_0843 [Rhodovulum sp. PH10]
MCGRARSAAPDRRRDGIGTGRALRTAETADRGVASTGTRLAAAAHNDGRASATTVLSTNVPSGSAPPVRIRVRCNATDAWVFQAWNSSIARFCVAHYAAVTQRPPERRTANPAAGRGWRAVARTFGRAICRSGKIRK